MKTTANTPFELFFDQLRDLHSMEAQLCESMPRLVPFCTNENLRELLARHSQQNSDQIAQIAAIFERHGQPRGDDKCKAMAGLIEGGTAHLEEVQCKATRDLMMIAHCLRVEYYEMAAYEFTTRLSERLGLEREHGILRNLLAEEKEMATNLVRLEPALFETANAEA